MVITEHENMRQFDRRVTTYTLARRNALCNRAFGRANGRSRANGVLICIKVNHADQTHADRAVFQRPLHIDIAVFIGLKDIFRHILRHGLVDQSGMGSFLGSAELGLRQDQIDGGRRVTGSGTDTVRGAVREGGTSVCWAGGGVGGLGRASGRMALLANGRAFLDRAIALAIDLPAPIGSGMAHGFTPQGVK